MRVRALLALTAVFLQLLQSATSEVDQSTCRVIWIFSLPCTEPVSALSNQVKAWSTKKCRDSQEKCMYELVEESPTHLEIKHTSPNTHKTNTIIFDFHPPSASSFCKAKSTSTPTSHNATSPNDYCLLYNLMEGSGLTQAKGYKEISNDAICPSRKSAPCNNE